MTNDFDDLDEFKDLIDEVKAAGQVPEPSPLFWNHLSARVGEAVAAQPAPLAWWQRSWRPLATIATVFGVVAMAVLVRPALRPTLAPSVLPVAADAPDATAASAAMDDETEAMWDMISALAPSIPADVAVAAGIEAGRGATEAAIDALTDAERRELVKLLRAEIGSSE